MNILAEKLNETLKESKVYPMLSDYGRRMYVPKGIIVQSAEAKEKASKYNATIGVALDHGTAMYIPGMKRQFADSMKPGEIFPYSPMGGNKSLRQVWQDEMKVKNPSLSGKRMSLPVVCSGLTNALSLVASLFLDKGDAVVLPEMYWENYDLIFDEQREARKVMYPNFKGEGYNVEGLDAVMSSVKADKMMVVFNFPNNPTGYTPTVAEAERIADVVKKHAKAGKKVMAVCDDAYFGLFFEKDVCRESLFTRLCDADENILAIKCDAATKEEMAWGFRIAFITYAFKGCSDASLDALVQKTMGAVRGCLSNCSTAGQNILLKGMKDPDYAKDKKAGIDKVGERYFAFKKALAAYAGKKCLKPLPFNSGYFMSFETAPDAEKLRQHLLEKYATGSIRLGDHLLRLAFSSVDVENIPGLVETVYKAAEELS